MIETNRGFVHRQAVTLCQAVDHARGRYGAHHRSAPAARFGQVAQRKGHDLVRINKVAPPIHGTNAVGIAVGSQAQMAHARAHRPCQRPQVASNWLRMHPTKTRVHLAADLRYLAAGALQDALDHAAPRAEHRIHHHLLGIVGDSVEVDQLAHMVVISRQRVEALDQAQLARLVKIHQVWPASALLVIGQVHFHPPALLRQGRATVSRLELDAIVTRRIVRRRDHHPADGPQVAHAE